MKYKIPHAVWTERPNLLNELRQVVENARDNAPIGTPLSELPFLCDNGTDVYVDWSDPNASILEHLHKLGAIEADEIPRGGDCS